MGFLQLINSHIVLYYSGAYNNLLIWLAWVIHGYFGNASETSKFKSVIIAYADCQRVPKCCQSENKQFCLKFYEWTGLCSFLKPSRVDHHRLCNISLSVYLFTTPDTKRVELRWTFSNSVPSIFLKQDQLNKNILTNSNHPKTPGPKPQGPKSGAFRTR